MFQKQEQKPQVRDRKKIFKIVFASFEVHQVHAGYEVFRGSGC